MSARYIVGDSLQVLRTLPDASVDLVLTSPPFLALRSYLPADHPDKAKEMGSEPTPGAFLDALLDIVEECRRVLAPHGSICVELGDTYSGSGGAGGDYGPSGFRAGQQEFNGSAAQRRSNGVGDDYRPARTRILRPNQSYRLNDDGTVKSDTQTRLAEPKNGVVHEVPLNGGDGWPLAKSLCLIPELFRFALVYGFNPLTSRQTPRWRVRNVVRWCRNNPPVGALGDKVRPATSDMVIACVDRKRYFDLDAIRVQASPNTNARLAKGVAARANTCKTSPDGNRDSLAIIKGDGTAPPLDHWWHDDVFDQDAWNISTQPYKGSHYATWPEELCRKPILAMCPQRVCTTCGKPSERISETTQHGHAPNGKAVANGRKSESPVHAVRTTTTTTTLGWTDCGHNTWRPGVVLDPFAGSGTTLAVAVGLGRSAIGIDLDPRNADLARERVGLFLDIEHHGKPTNHGDADHRDAALDVPANDYL